MSVQLDPITGLPIDLQPATWQQIPLNSQPIVAPEWQPQGRVMSTLYPDNIPTVFSTLQAQNADNGQQVRALRTHTGTQALEVYDLASAGGGAGTTLAPIKPSSYTYEETSAGGLEFLGHLGKIGSNIYGLTWSWTWNTGGVRPAGTFGKVILEMNQANAGLPDIYLASIVVSVPTYVSTDKLCGEVHRTFSPPLAFPSADNDGTGNYSLYLNHVLVGGGTLSLTVWAD